MVGGMRGASPLAAGWPLTFTGEAPALCTGWVLGVKREPLPHVIS